MLEMGHKLVGILHLAQQFFVHFVFSTVSSTQQNGLQPFSLVHNQMQLLPEGVSVISLQTPSVRFRLLKCW